MSHLKLDISIVRTILFGRFLTKLKDCNELSGLDLDRDYILAVFVLGQKMFWNKKWSRDRDLNSGPLPYHGYHRLLDNT